MQGEYVDMGEILNLVTRGIGVFFFAGDCDNINRGVHGWTLILKGYLCLDLWMDESWCLTS